MAERSTLVRGFLCLAVALLALLPAAACATPVESGTARLEPGKNLRTALGREGVTLAGVAGATNQGPAVELSARAGVLDQATASGHLLLSGALRLRAGKRKLVIRGLMLDTVKKELRARVGQRRNFVLARVVAPKPTPRLFGIDLEIAALPLTAAATKLLSERFGLEHPLRARVSLGTMRIDTDFSGVLITGGTLGFTLDEGFRQKLAALDVTARRFESGTESATLPLSFSWPVEATTLNASLTRGWIGPVAGIGLFQGEGPPSPEGQLQRMMRFWRFALNFEANAATVMVEARGGDGSYLATFHTPLAQVDVRAATRIDEATRTVSMAPTLATLSADAAAAMNANFAAGKATQFVTGEPFGYYSFSASL